MDTKDEKKLKNQNEIQDETIEYDIEEYYDENADKKHLGKYQPKALYEKYTKSKNGFVIVCLVFAILLAFLFGPFFQTTEITITGNSFLSRDEILKVSGLSLGINTLKADVNGAAKKISELPLVDKVDVQRVSPSKIKITIVECVEVGIIKYLGNYVTVSSDGKVLEINEKKPKKDVPELLNVKLGETNIGKILVFTNEKDGEVILKYLKTLENSTVLKEIKNINFKNVNDVNLTLKNEILVEMGQADKISYKFAFLEKVFIELSGQRGGVLDISNPDKNVGYKAT